MSRTALVVGAGPAGLTAAYELLRRTDLRPVIVEAEAQVGGLARTIEYRGNRMDLGGHRFYSQSDWVLRWWRNMLPLAEEQPQAERALLVRPRLSRILYRRHFYPYPLRLQWQTLRNLGAAHCLRILASYVAARGIPRYPEASLEDFLINRFGRALYETFFRSYTEKVWGVSCCQIDAAWGAQRIQGMSVAAALRHAVAHALRGGRPPAGQVQRSLIERFLYPRLGPGQMWEEVAERVRAGGGTLYTSHRLVAIERAGGHISAGVIEDRSGQRRTVPCDLLISSMPLGELTTLLQPSDPQLLDIAAGLPHRDFVTVGVLLRAMPGGMPPDNWIYIHDPDVQLGRLQIFNNWSAALVADPATIWLGLEYFCQRNDALWSLPDSRLQQQAVAELARLGLARAQDVLDATVVRVPRAYPAYFGSYGQLPRLRDYLCSFANLFAVGRNGLHRYNNQDHSMLAARAVVDTLAVGHPDPAAGWNVAIGEDYLERLAPRSVGVALDPDQSLG
jgi:protoporphyrinogen oxidase